MKSNTFVQVAPQVLAGIDVKEELKKLLQAFETPGGEYVVADVILAKSAIPLPRAQILIEYLAQHNFVKTTGLAGGSDSLPFHFGQILPLGKRILQGHDEFPD